MLGGGWVVDLKIIGNHLSGTIIVTNVEQHGSGCELSMQGSNDNWAGTWWCGEFTSATLHSFTAIATRVNGHIAQK
jgi:hypothetical protein